MTPAELDEWGLCGRERVKETVESTGKIALGAILLLNLDPVTGEAEMFPIAVTGMTDQHHEALAKTVMMSIDRYHAKAMLLFTRCEKDGKPHVWVSYERDGCRFARDWFAEIKGSSVGEFTERLSEPAFFTPPPLDPRSAN